MTTVTHDTAAGNPRVPEVLTIEEVAAVLRRSRASLYNDIAAGTFPIPHFRLGNSLRVSRVALDRFLAGE